MKREKNMITLGRERHESGLQPAPKVSFKTPVVAALALTLATGADRALGDLVALYRFDGSAVADIAGAQKAGAFNGQTFDGAGVGAHSLSPDFAPTSGGLGSLALNGGYIDLPTALSAVNPFRGKGTISGNQGGDFTITCWFKTTAGGIIMSSARDNTPTNYSFAMFVGGDGGDKLIGDFFYQGEIVQGSGANNDAWHFGAITYKVSNNVWTIKLDDAAGANTVWNEIPNAYLDTIRIGGSRNTEYPQPNPFNGKVSDVAIFNHVLTPTELAAVKTGNFSAYLQTPGAPTSTNDSLTIVEDTPTPLAVSDFGDYSDPYPLEAIKIISLPAKGSLEYDTGFGSWTAVVVDQEISAAHIAAGRLRFSPAADGNGDPYASFTFKVGNGSFFSANYTLTVTVIPVNDYNPTGVDRTVSVAQRGFRTLNAATFGFADADGNDTLQMIKVTQLPSAGSLTLRAVAVELDQEITVEDLNAGYLRFTPAPGATGPAYATFGFQVSDGTLYSTSANTITIDLLDVGITHSASPIPFDNLGSLVGARVFEFPGTYDGIPFALWSGPFPGATTIGSGVTAEVITFQPTANGLGGVNHQYATSLYTPGNAPGALNVSGLDTGKTYQVQIAFGDLREGSYPYITDTVVSLGDGRSATLPMSIGTAPTGDEYARISARVTGTTSFRLDLPTDRYGVGPIIAGFSVHEQSFTSYATWASVNGASSNPSDDSNNNGVPNGVEFFMGATTGNPATLPALVDTSGTWNWTLPYDPLASASHKFQSSGDLLGWADALPGEVQFLTSPNRVKFTLPAGTDKKFCRLLVTPTP